MLQRRGILLFFLFFSPFPEKCRGSDTAPSLAIIQPGRPGSPKAAEGFLARLGEYLASQTKLARPSLSYQNKPEEALAALEKKNPDLGIVSLGFYLEHRKRFGFKAVLEAYPLRKYVLVASEGKVKTASDLDGKLVMGGPLYEPKFVRRILFPETEKTAASLAGWKGASAWVPKPTTRVSSALYQLGKNRIRAVLLYDSQYESMKNLGRLKKVEKVIESSYYPPAVIVAFRGAFKSAATVSEEQRLLITALEKISTVKDAGGILQQMGCKEFRGIRSGWLSEVEKKYHFERGEKSEEK
jgi:hypothetical protein